MTMFVLLSFLFGVIQSSSTAPVRSARYGATTSCYFGISDDRIRTRSEIAMYNIADSFMSPVTSPDTVQNLMSRFRMGDKQAAGELVSLFYPELRRLAAARMRSEQPNHTWQPTGLVNELYLELLKVRALSASDSDGEGERRAFLSLAAHMMRRLLIQHSRPLARRSGKSELPDLPDARISGAEALAEVEEALERLASINPNLRTVVELRVFEGLTGQECAERMGVGTATVSRYWVFARQWLEVEFGKPLVP
jgi:RNA polymerase sigma factor (TIGR02999 family)